MKTNNSLLSPPKKAITSLSQRGLHLRCVGQFGVGARTTRCGNGVVRTLLLYNALLALLPGAFLAVLITATAVAQQRLHVRLVHAVLQVHLTLCEGVVVQHGLDGGFILRVPHTHRRGEEELVNVLGGLGRVRRHSGHLQHLVLRARLGKLAGITSGGHEREQLVAAPRVAALLDGANQTRAVPDGAVCVDGLGPRHAAGGVARHRQQLLADASEGVQEVAEHALVDPHVLEVEAEAGLEHNIGVSCVLPLAVALCDAHSEVGLGEHRRRVRQQHGHEAGLVELDLGVCRGLEVDVHVQTEHVAAHLLDEEGHLVGLADGVLPLLKVRAQLRRRHVVHGAALRDVRGARPSILCHCDGKHPRLERVLRAIGREFLRTACRSLQNHVRRGLTHCCCCFC
eukprot:PhM_4_TR10947/c1_g1_i1/m.88530